MKGYNDYQRAEYIALHGRKQDTTRKTYMYDLKFRGENIKLNCPYAVCVARRKELVSQYGWKHSLFTITRHV